MRKVLIIFFILLALGGTGFFFGWAQLTVPPGSYGVMRSKTHGLDRTLIREGEFRWVWYKLIPSNTDIQVYRPLPVERRINHRGTLPSSAVYASFSGIEADFSYEITATLSFSIGPESLIPLIEERNITGQDELNAYTNSLAEEIGGFVLGQLQQGGGGEEELERILKTGSSPKLEEEIRRSFPQTTELSCRIQAIRFPDLALYYQLRNLYTDYITGQQEHIAKARNENSARHVDFQFRVDELSHYGDLLTKYPILLEYLKLEAAKGSGQGP
ncbi:MAG: hypothetical protein LBG07_01660 [Treponema sp.]|jgi:hypothetical protein|nr:hypothetical protein [Treponema sp.]